MYLKNLIETMDTNENNEPVGGEDVSSSQDTSENIAQPAETEEVVDGNQSEEAGEALLAGKYKSPEELEKAYKELESKLGQRNETSDLARMLEEETGMTSTQIRDYIARQREANLVAQYQDNPVPYLANELQTVKQQLFMQSKEKKLDAFLQENPVYAPNRDKILKLALTSERGKDYGDIAAEWFGNAIAQGQQAAYKKIETKKMTQATGASQAAPKSKLTLEDMDKMSLAELEAVLPHADTSNRLY